MCCGTFPECLVIIIMSRVGAVSVAFRVAAAKGEKIWNVSVAPGVFCMVAF